MFIKLSSLVLAVLLIIVLYGNLPREDGSSISPFLYILSVVLLIVASLTINFKRVSFTWPHLFLPIMYLVSVAGVFAIIPTEKGQYIFLIFASLVFYLLETKLGRESHFLQNIYLLSAFGLYLGVFAIEFYLGLKVWLLVPLVFILTYLLAIHGFAGFSLPSKKYFYLLIAVIVSQVAWGLSFWPNHFFVKAVVAFCFYYVLWLFAFSAFFGKLARQKVYWQLTLVIIVLLLALSTAAWRPLR